MSDLENQAALENGVDREPSLDHQLRAFLESIRTLKAPPSHGAIAIPVVETLEEIRKVLAENTSYLLDSRFPISLIVELAENIHARLGGKGGIVAVDGASGVGKSSIIRILADYFELKYPSIYSSITNLDEFRISPEESLALKKRILGEPLTAEEESFLEEFRWGHVKPNKIFRNEGSLWRHRHPPSVQASLRHDRINHL